MPSDDAADGEQREAPAATDEPARDRPWHSAVAGVASVALLLAAVEVALLLLARGGVMSERRLFLTERLSVVGIDLLALFACVAAAGAVVVGILAGGRAVAKRVSMRRLRGAIVAASVAAALGFAWALLVLWAASWGLFWSAGSFLNSAGFEFWWTQPVQVLHWATPATILLLPVTLAATALLVLVVPRWAARKPKRRGRIARAMIAALVWTAAMATLGVPHDSRAGLEVPTEGVPTMTEVLYAREKHVADVYESAILRRGGAFAGAAGDVFGLLWTGEAHPVVSRDIKVDYKPILPINDYVARASPPAGRRPNVIVVVVESLRADQFIALGATRDEMPHVNAMAEQSAVFADAYAQASHTNYAALCPLSGQYPLRSAFTHVYPPDPPYPRVTIYDLLKPLGYRTALFSSENEWWGKMLNYLDTGGLDTIQHAANYAGETFVAPTDTGFAAWVANTKGAGSVDDRYTVDSAVKWLDDGPREQPFFLWLKFQSSHTPYLIPPDAPHLFGPRKIDFDIPFGYFPPEKRQVVLDLYADSLHYLDDQIGRLFDYLKQSGRWDDTIVVFTGDHGEAFMEHGFSAHGNVLYQETQRVPLVIKAPGLSPGVRRTPAQQIDVPPTLLGLLGLPPHPAYQGMDLFGDVPAWRSIYMVCQTPIAEQYAIVRGRYKLMLDVRPFGASLFDLEADPGETKSVADAHPAVVKSLLDRLQTWRAVQLEYYESPPQYDRFYPPVLEEGPGPTAK